MAGGTGPKKQKVSVKSGGGCRHMTRFGPKKDPKKGNHRTGKKDDHKSSRSRPWS